jgi:hypothetical protein
MYAHIDVGFVPHHVGIYPRNLHSSATCLYPIYIRFSIYEHVLRGGGQEAKPTYNNIRPMHFVYDTLIASLGLRTLPSMSQFPGRAEMLAPLNNNGGINGAALCHREGHVSGVSLLL